MAKSPSKEDRERLVLAIEMLSGAFSFITREGCRTLGFRVLGDAPLPDKDTVLKQSAAILYDAISSAHNRIDELEEADENTEEALLSMDEWLAKKVKPVVERYDWNDVETVIRNTANTNPSMGYHYVLLAQNGTVVDTAHKDEDRILVEKQIANPILWHSRVSDRWEKTKPRIVEAGVTMKLTAEEVSEAQRVRDLIRMDAEQKAQGKEYDTLDEDSMRIMCMMRDYGFYNGGSGPEYKRLQTLRRLGYIRHCYWISENAYFWVLREKGYAYLRVFDAIP